MYIGFDDQAQFPKLSFLEAFEHGFKGYGGHGNPAGVVERVVADQIPNVGDGPALTGFDEEVVPELLDVGMHEIRLALDEAQDLMKERFIKDKLVTKLKEREENISE